MDWGSVADWVSGAGSILASVVALYLAGSERRARRESERPEISVELGAVENDGWAKLSLAVLNPSLKEWQLDKLEILRPKHGLVVRQRDTLEDVKPWQAEFSSERRSRMAARSANVASYVRAAGSTNPSFDGGGPANKMWESFEVYIGAIPAHLTLRLSFSSREPKPDRFSIDVERMVEGTPAKHS